MACICKSHDLHLANHSLCLGIWTRFHELIELLFKITKICDALYSKWSKQTEKRSGYADTNNYK